MNIKNIKSSLVLVIASFLFLVSFHNALALTISPARIEVSGDAGTSVTKEITLMNDSKTGEETFYITYSNFESQGESGSPLFVEPKSDLGTWMTTTATSVTLKANESKKVPVTINIPKDAYAGGHFAVVFFGVNSTEGGSQVSVGAKTGTLVMLSVNGDVLEAGGLADFKTNASKLFYNSLPVNFQYRFKNDGNDRVKPEGNIVIRNMAYYPTSKIDANVVSGNILPHSTRLFDVEWTKDMNTNTKQVMDKSFLGRASYQWKNFAMGPYFANIDLKFGSNGVHSTKQIFFFVFPWQLLIIIIAILSILFFGGKKLLKIYKKSIIAEAQLEMKENK